MTTGAFALSSDSPFSKSSGNTNSNTNLWLVDDNAKSDARLKYEQLLTEDLFGFELRIRFDELFGEISDEYLLDNFDIVFDTPADQVDQGLLQILLHDSIELGYSDSYDYLDDDPTIDIIMKNQDLLAASIPPPVSFTAPNADIFTREAFIPEINDIQTQKASHPIQVQGSNESLKIDTVITQGDEGEISGPALAPTSLSYSASIEIVSTTHSSIEFNVEFSPSSSWDHTVQWYDGTLGSWTIIRGNGTPDIGGTENIIMADLQPSTYYGVYVGTWDYDNSVWISDQLFEQTTADPGVVYSASIDVISLESSSVEFDVDFSPTSSWDHTVQWYDSSLGGWTIIRGNGTSDIGATENIIMPSLTPSTIYGVYVGTWDYYNSVWISDQIFVITPALSGPNTGTKLALVSKTAYSITVKPTFPTSGKSGNELFVQTYGAHSTETSYTSLCGNAGKNQNYTISGLTPEAPYTFILSYFDSNNVNHQEEYSFTTNYAAPGLVSTDGQSYSLNLESQQIGLFNAGLLPRIVAKNDSANNSLANWLGTSLPSGYSKVNINADRTLHGTPIEGISGNPIKWSSCYVPRAANRANLRNNDVVEIFFHEIGHNFDHPNWSFEPEALTNLYMYYLVKSNNWTMVSGCYDSATYQGANLKTYYKSYVKRMSGHVNYDASIAKGTYSPYGLAYNLAVIMDQTGYGPFEDAFAYMRALDPSAVPSTSIGKFNMLLSLVQDISGVNVFGMFNSNEKSVYETKLGGNIQYSPTEYFTKVLNVPRAVQENDNWCWAACAYMVGYYVYPSSSATQTSIVEEIHGNTNDDPGSIWEVANAIEFVSDNTVNASTTLLSPKSFNDHKSKINSNKPLVMRIGLWNYNAGAYLINGEGHYLVIDGYNIPYNQSLLRTIDPLPEVSQGEHTKMYEYIDLINGCYFASGNNGMYMNTIDYN